MSKKKNAAMEAEKNIPEQASEPENPESLNQEATLQEEPEDQMSKDLSEAKAKAEEYLSLAQRVQADFENYRRRNENVRSDAYADGKKDVAAMMLPILDNLERAVQAASDSSDESLKSGISMVLKQMADTFQKLDVKPIERTGEKFDPNLENAILQGTEEEGEPGTVCQVLQKGYMIGDKVLRYAMVKVVPE